MTQSDDDEGRGTSRSIETCSVFDTGPFGHRSRRLAKASRSSNTGRVGRTASQVSSTRTLASETGNTYPNDGGLSFANPPEKSINIGLGGSADVFTNSPSAIWCACPFGAAEARIVARVAPDASTTERACTLRPSASATLRPDASADTCTTAPSIHRSVKDLSVRATKASRSMRLYERSIRCSRWQTTSTVVQVRAIGTSSPARCSFQTANVFVSGARALGATIRTSNPARTRSIASHRPAGPQPMTSTSQVVFIRKGTIRKTPGAFKLPRATRLDFGRAPTLQVTLSNGAWLRCLHQFPRW
jgi:hypothetical protein